MIRQIALLILVFFTCSLMAFPQGSSNGARPVVVQGAMNSETEKLAGRLDNVTIEQVGGWTFWRGTVGGYPVIVSRTLKGVANAAAASAIVIGRYNVPFIGIRIVSDNTTNGDDYEPKTGEASQDYVYQVVKAYIAAIAHQTSHREWREISGGILAG